MTLLDDTLSAIVPASAEALAAAEARQLRLTKPAGSLGRLEEIGNRLAAIADACPPPLPARAVIGLFAGDHGVCAQGVSPWPQEVTVQMALNIASGGAAINAIARQVGAEVWVTDVGVAAEVPEHPGIRARNVRRGTRDFTVEPALTRDEARAALEVGIEAANEAIDAGADVLLTGEMGIGNTTPASALIAVFSRLHVTTVTGRGAGADDDMLTRKVRVIDDALTLHRPDPADPLGVLAAVGGLEHAALAGFILGAAARRIPVIIDGVIAASAACVAAGFDESVTGYLIAGHAGVEPGIKAALTWLDLQPLVDLDLRLGEGTGAALALPTVQAAARILSEMATFDSAGVAEG
ncbi:nicotinate-nucleotide--dimethylbenzimidazole phosphoribosyltransferase [Tessaracoccus lapidicaptus]|uniref:Nicotinate-nucleotide--dimethylbenzimidazole phosphoribosyltransferase n=1 Tax=Tessaracoccus lapidicaptus TaxID=1427523 RepID=A0A1C0ALT5_9ACTN|nr:MULTISPECIES: nicotinate-nucleotide--dimethylbenzimidazole phosphoribosyltransferase [Tessaracoccus]AQX15467.1 nicotinate-nucleotide--dimethylbenzimidazole phosphoribosyltransferase [Tessaracoccus sp. T2.5-30]OCL33835.1 nicotinate-nucleotide--dimethylbenzimidazole phosphoribosyltransferase [Tessaracoccus lapidicaptus]VEP39786.1 Nicotinate-nucleotide--dimethylbenzimidazole phosphoribosyltransferase [Tessaracoccus lapidicaptus]